MESPPDKLIKTQRKRARQPTILQIKALQNYNQGMNITKAMREAGYSKNTASYVGKKFFKMEGTQTAVQSIMRALETYGITVEKMAQKIAEFVDAKKIHGSFTEPDREVADYQTQIQGIKLLREIMKEEMPAGTGQKKRELTITEFVTGEKEEPNA